MCFLTYFNKQYILRQGTGDAAVKVQHVSALWMTAERLCDSPVWGKDLCCLNGLNEESHFFLFGSKSLSYKAK